MMSTIRGRDTKPELVLRKALHGQGFRYRLHAKHLPGRPDLVLPKWNAVIFVHGCFWHRHPECRFATTPATRPDFWRKKFEANVLRDARAEAEIRKRGVRIAIVWECGLRRPDRALETLDAVREWLTGPTDRFESRLVEPIRTEG
nr:DNA mismatch endonuclease Vsr [Leisingera thetidis]